MTDLAVGAAERALTDVERTTAKADGPAVLEQQPLRRKKPKRAERELRLGTADGKISHPAPPRLAAMTKHAAKANRARQAVPLHLRMQGCRLKMIPIILWSSDTR